MSKPTGRLFCEEVYPRSVSRRACYEIAHPNSGCLATMIEQSELVIRYCECRVLHRCVAFRREPKTGCTC